MLGVYLAYLAQALLRGHSSGGKEKWSKKEIALALDGVGALILGVVKSTEQIVSYFGISRVGGLHCPKFSPPGV